MMTTDLQKQATQNTTKRKSKHYVNNGDFLKALIEYQSYVNQCKEENKRKPPIPKYIGECIMQIANRLSHKPNFVNYSFRNEMISDGIENCFLYLHNFNPEKSNNAFAYFTQIIKFAFIRRIQKERKQMFIRHKISEMQLYLNTRKYNEHENENAEEFIRQYEKMLEEKRLKVKRSNKKEVEKV